MTELTARELLLHLYQSAVDAVDGRYLVAKWLRNNRDQASQYSHCVAIGKAAAAMLDGACDQCPSIKASLLICPPDKITRKQSRDDSITCVGASHPVPDERSLEAGRQLVQFLSGLQEADKVLFLISGGTSALVEVLADGLTLDDLQAINRYLLSSGKDIHRMNAWRQQFSKIKGGGLLHYLHNPATLLLISDVKADRMEFIGSGLLVKTDAEPDEDGFLAGFPRYQRPPVDDNLVEAHIIGNLDIAKQAIHQAALAEGLDSTVYHEFIDGDVQQAAQYLSEQLEQAPAGIHIWGGEPTVRLPENPGIGGRNQALALYFALHIQDKPGIHLLSGGTDGVDGSGNSAGGVVSMYTMQKATKMGIDVDAELAKANSGVVLMATDDLVPRQDSNTNVMDVIIAYKE